MAENRRARETFETPLSLKDLLRGGVKFELKNNFESDQLNDLFDKMDIDSDDDDFDYYAHREQLISPWSSSFMELRAMMNKVDDFIWKRIKEKGERTEFRKPLPDDVRVTIRYQAFWEGETTAFDASVAHEEYFKFVLGRRQVLEGLEAAVRTMRFGEKSLFLIGHQLMFGKMGCPPRIKPKAEALFDIELSNIEVIGDATADLLLSEEDRTKFRIVQERVKQIHLSGIDQFRNENYKKASVAFERAISILSYSRSENEEEEQESCRLLLTLNTNLAVCCNKLKQYQKCVLVCKEIRRIGKGKPSSKAIFQEGRALLKLGEYAEASKILAEAQSLEPQNEEIINEIMLLEDLYSRHKEKEREICKRVFRTAVKDSNKKSVYNTETNPVKMLVPSIKTSFDETSIKHPPISVKSSIEKLVTPVSTIEPIIQKTVGPTSVVKSSIESCIKTSAKMPAVSSVNTSKINPAKVFNKTVVQKNKSDEKTSNYLETFVAEWRIILADLKENLKDGTFQLPMHLSREEFSIIMKLSDEYRMKCYEKQNKCNVFVIENFRH